MRDAAADLVVIRVALCSEECWRERQCSLEGFCILHPHAAAVKIGEEPPTAAHQSSSLLVSHF